MYQKDKYKRNSKKSRSRSRSRSHSKEKYNQKEQNRSEIFKDHYYYFKQFSDFEQIYQVFKEMPKPADLHTHYSSLVSYERLIKDIKEKNLYEQLYFGYEIYKNNRTFCLFFKSDLENNKQLRIENQCKYDKNEEKFNTILNKILFEIKNKKHKYSKEGFEIYKVLGDAYYNLIKSDLYMFSYVELILKNMQENAIFYLESRIKYDNLTQKIFDYILKQNATDKIKFIIQFPRYNVKRFKQEMKELLKNQQFQKYCQQNLVIGVDFTGEEQQVLNVEDLIDKEVSQLLQQLKIQFYQHAGEGLEKNQEQLQETQLIIQQQSENQEQQSQQIKKQQIQQNIFYQNVDQLLKNIENNKKMYINPPRIGHGVYYLQNQQINFSDICFEVCPLSNLFFIGQSLQIKNIIENFKVITICSDDENKVEADLALNFCYLYYQGLNKKDIYQKILENSISFSSASNVNKNEMTNSFGIQFQQWLEKNNQLLKLE